MNKILPYFLLCFGINIVSALYYELDSNTIAYWNFNTQSSAVEDLGNKQLDGQRYNSNYEDSSIRFTNDENRIRNSFRSLKDLSIKVAKKHENNSHIEMKYLSMGMTSDFEIALEEGANMLRIGSAIFGG